MRKTIRFTCSNCHIIFHRELRKIKKQAKNYYCSPGCHYRHEFILTLEKATKPYSESWQELIYRWYVLEKISMREITRKLKVNYRTTQKVLKVLNIPQRSTHDRIALQWVGNEKRRKENANRMSSLFKGKPGWNKGLTKKSNPSVKKQSEWMTGKNNPMYGKRGKAHHCYKNGKYTADKKRFWNTSEYQQWRKAVYERDNYTCQECGNKKSGNFNAHHIKSFANYPKLRYIVSNGITLCKNCHQLVHSSMKPEIAHRQRLCRGGVEISS